MDQAWRTIVDAEGRKGSFRLRPEDDSQAEVKLETGEQLRVPSAFVSAQRDGTCKLEQSFSKLLAQSSESELVLPVLEEQLSVDKRVVDRERVRIHVTVASREEVIEVPLTREELKVERVPIGRNVENAEQPRQEGDIFVIPVYEEVLVVKKQLVLREEIRVTCTRHEDQTRQRATLRRENASIERSGAQAEDRK